MSKRKSEAEHIKYMRTLNIVVIDVKKKIIQKIIYSY